MLAHSPYEDGISSAKNIHAMSPMIDCLNKCRQNKSYLVYSLDSFLRIFKALLHESHSSPLPITNTNWEYFGPCIIVIQQSSGQAFSGIWLKTPFLPIRISCMPPISTVVREIYYTREINSKKVVNMVGKLLCNII